VVTPIEHRASRRVPKTADGSIIHPARVESKEHKKNGCPGSPSHHHAYYSPCELLVRRESLLLSEQSGSSGQRRLALGVAVAFTIAFLSILFIGDRKLPHSVAYVPILDSIMFMSDLITATLLYLQYYLSRQSRSLALGMGYLFSALIIIPHLLTFPGNFSPTGLLGADVDTAFWLYYFCRLGFFIGVIAYSLLGEPHYAVETVLTSRAMTITRSIVGVAVLVFLLTMAATRTGFLPGIMLDSVQTESRWNYILAPALILVIVVAITRLWRQRSSLLSMWLLVALWAWLIETMLLSQNSVRFTLFWYGGVFGMIASCIVLLVLLYEATMLYARAALSAEARSKEGERQRVALQVVAGSVAHELRQPLAAIIHNSDAVHFLIAQNPPNLPEVRAAIDDVTSEANRASDIISSINVTLTGVPSPVAPVSIGKIVSDTLKLLRGELHTNNVAVQLEIPSDLPMALGNSSQLMQVLINLITNAIESMSIVTGRPRLLTIRASQGSPSKVSVIVSDSGKGIDPEHAARIFDPYFTTKAHGTGLGLAICRRIIEAHGGHISTSFATDCGLAFEILLPTA
jgi:signal transduction histidine kinase